MADIRIPRADTCELVPVQYGCEDVSWHDRVLHLLGDVGSFADRQICEHLIDSPRPWVTSTWHPGLALCFPCYDATPAPAPGPCDRCGETSIKGFQHIQTSDHSVAVIRYCTDCQADEL